MKMLEKTFLALFVAGLSLPAVATTTQEMHQDTLKNCQKGLVADGLKPISTIFPLPRDKAARVIVSKAGTVSISLPDRAGQYPLQLAVEGCIDVLLNPSCLVDETGAECRTPGAISEQFDEVTADGWGLQIYLNKVQITRPEPVKDAKASDLVTGVREFFNKILPAPKATAQEVQQ